MPIEASRALECSRGEFFREVGGTKPKIILCLLRNYEMLHCIGKSYWFSRAGSLNRLVVR